MRVELDTNILVSALLVSLGHPTMIYRAWQEGYFTLRICAEQLDELRAALHRPAIRERIKPYKADRLVDQLKELADYLGIGGDRQRYEPLRVGFALSGFLILAMKNSITRRAGVGCEKGQGGEGLPGLSPGS